MLIHNPKFVTSLTGNGDFTGRGLPEVAIAGRSNVGKSSLINCILNRKAISRVSGTPGKTRTINVYNIDEMFFLMDLPGYGFANVSQSMRDDWGRMMDDYFLNSPYLRHVLHLVDIRHDPSKEDVKMAGFIQRYQIPCTVIATKADKLSRAQQQRALMPIYRGLGVQPWDVIPFSSQTKQGKDAVLERLEKALPPKEETPSE